jgi:hypothetical protein
MLSMSMGDLEAIGGGGGADGGAKVVEGTPRPSTIFASSLFGGLDDEAKNDSPRFEDPMLSP